MTYEGQRLKLVDVERDYGAAVCGDLMVWVWREPPHFSAAECALQILARISRSAKSQPGLWVVTHPGCTIPSVSVRRLMASHLRLCPRLQFHGASVEGEDYEGTLMRAAMRSIAVAAGVRSAKIAPDITSVAAELPDHFPGLGPAWGQHAVRVVRAAMAHTPAWVPQVYGTTRDASTGPRGAQPLVR